jgi:hypothetical protein
MKKNSAKAVLKKYLVDRARKAGQAGVGECKRRGDSKYYSKLAKKRFKKQ